jgi:hypothetical protein
LGFSGEYLAISIKINKNRKCRDVSWNFPTEQYNVITKKCIVIAKGFEGVSSSFGEKRELF